MNTIKIIRLKNGEDIIGSIKKSRNSIDITEPMTVGVEQRGQYAGQLVMSNWLPVSLIKDNKTKLKTEDILIMLDPDDKFREYYESMVIRLNEMIEAKNEVKEMSNEEISAILNAMEGLDNVVIH